MANPEHLAILKQGVTVWNEWRNSTSGEPDLSEADLHHMNLRGINLVRASLFRANLSGINLTDADLTATSFIEANLRSAKLSNAYMLGTLLNRADLSHATMRELHLQQADLIGANLTRVILNGSDLSEANLRNCILQHAYLNNVHFHLTDLRETKVFGSHIYESTFSMCRLDESDFDGAEIGSTIFSNVDLSNVKGLENVEYVAPSTIGIDTIFRSGGNIPDIFLRGCGVPDIFIEYAHSLISKPIQFYSSFISHSTKDKRFCERLYADLRANHVRTWYFPEDAKWGESVWGEIDRGIKIYDKLVIVCSKNSLTSGPVLREIERALNREDKEGKQILFPIRIDNYLFEEWEHPRKADVLAKVVGDFRGWNRSAAKYDEAFKKLVKALQA